MKRFNTTGICYPHKHYMVDITERLQLIRRMIDQGDYFCINRGRQYGKTTTLYHLKKFLEPDYVVFSLSFERLDDKQFESEESLGYGFFRLIYRSLKNNLISGLAEESELKITKIVEEDKPIPLFKCSAIIEDICIRQKIVLMIDEVDQASNHQSFVKFLGMLRAMFLQREDVPTFQSVILAGVYDIKNLKLKMRPEEEHQYNSPWNIAVPFSVDMSLQADGIAGMLRDYKMEHSVDFDEVAVAQEIRDYTYGYPFLVSRICQIMDEKGSKWNHEGVVDAVHDILNESNTLFDDMVKKMDDFPDLQKLLRNILFVGERKSISVYEKYVELGLKFCFLRAEGNVVKIANRIIETVLYNLFIAEDNNQQIYTEGSIDKNQFIHDGILDVRRLIERFSVHFNDIYGKKDEAFVERHGRQFFLLYLRPIINGIGNYYIEAETRDETRTDIVIDYNGRQYVIETKVWRGNAYNERGEAQLSEYLDYFHLNEGFMVSFCFNKGKKPGVQAVAVRGKRIIEAIV